MGLLVHDRALERTVSIILALPELPVSVQTVASNAGYSPRHMHRILHRLHLQGVVLRVGGQPGVCSRYYVDVPRAVELGYLPEISHAA